MPADLIHETTRFRDDRFQDKFEEGPATLPGVLEALAAGLRCLIVPTPLTAVDLCPPEAEIVPTLAGAVDLILNLCAEEKPR